MNASKLRRWWSEHGDAVLRTAVVFLGVLSIAYLGFHLWRLLFQVDPGAAGDLKTRHSEVAAWFRGDMVYHRIVTAVYPPASYVTLWPLLGWLPVAGARWLWAVTSVIALGGLAVLCVRQSGAETVLEKSYALMMPLSLYATGISIGNGQLPVHVLPLMVAGLLLFDTGEVSWPKDLAAAGLVILGLVKPSLTAPFVLIVLCIPNRSRPFILVCTGYLALCLFAAAFQDPGFIRLMTDWLDMARGGVRYGTLSVIKVQGHTSLSSWMLALGLTRWTTAAALTCLILLGLWVYRYRRADIWTRIGVMAVVARFWTYHLRYDDLLILLPMIAFFRIAKGRSSVSGGAWTGAVLLVATHLSLLAPGGTNFLPTPLKSAYIWTQILVWLTGFAYLIYRAHLERKADLGLQTGIG